VPAKKRVPKKKPSRPSSEIDELRARASRVLGISEEEAELRALRVLLATLPERPEESHPAAAAVSSGPLPQRLYLLLDGRGLDGRGMPVEVIDLPCVVGSGRHCSVWVNSPQIETRHLQIFQSEEGWVLEDLGSEHGTFFGNKKIRRKAIQHGDEYRLANYLRLRTELR
jgi:pSer/pThr/pTyr-binding forkhead associated (FHA) protein